MHSGSLAFLTFTKRISDAVRDASVEHAGTSERGAAEFPGAGFDSDRQEFQSPAKGPDSGSSMTPLGGSGF